MVEFVTDNRDWIFSGVGVAITLLIIGLSRKIIFALIRRAVPQTPSQSQRSGNRSRNIQAVGHVTDQSVTIEKLTVVPPTSQPLERVPQVAFTKQQVPEDIFDVRPVQSSGENIFHIYEKGKTSDSLDRFIVKVRFNLWTQYTFEIINCDLRYDLAVAMPTHQRLILNGTDYRFDSSYRMVGRHEVKPGSVVEVFASRDFICNAGRADRADYGKTNIAMEVAGPQWSGIRHLIIEGQLAPGGQLNILDVRLELGTCKSCHPYSK